MITPNVEIITPAIAEEYLKRNTLNRKMSKHRVAYYASQMKAGRWQLNGQAIIFDTEGNLLDGQQRLAAVIKSGCPIQVIVIRGISSTTMGTIDTGKARTAGDVFALRGAKSARAAAAAVKTRNTLFRGYAFSSATNGTIESQYSHDELWDIYKENEQIYDKAVCYAGTLVNAWRSPYSASCLGGVVSHLIIDKGYSWEDVKGFFDALYDVRNDGTYSLKPAIKALRRRLREDENLVRGQKMGAAYKGSLLVKTWNCYQRGADISRIVMRDDDAECCAFFPKKAELNLTPIY